MKVLDGVLLSTEELRTHGIARSQDGEISLMSSHDPDWVSVYRTEAFVNTIDTSYRTIKNILVKRKSVLIPFFHQSNNVVTGPRLFRESIQSILIGHCFKKI